MLGFTPPSTNDRLITGISWWSSDSDSKSWLKRKGAKSVTEMIGMDVATGNCAVSPATTVIRQPGQEVKFTLTAGVPLSRGHTVWWYAGSTSGQAFATA